MTGNAIVRHAQRAGHGLYVTDARGREQLAPWALRTMAHLVRVLNRLDAHLEAQRDLHGAPIVCEACGCLCRPDEHCPGCLAARTTRTTTEPLRRTA